MACHPVVICYYSPAIHKLDAIDLALRTDGQAGECGLRFCYHRATEKQAAAQTVASWPDSSNADMARPLRGRIRYEHEMAAFFMHCFFVGGMRF